MNKRSSATWYLLTVFLCIGAGSPAAHASECLNPPVPAADLIWCDSFEDADLPPSGNFSDNYFDFDGDNGDHDRTTAASFDGQYALRQRWQQSEVSAGAMFRTFGRSPVSSLSHSSSDFREIYWRMYVLYPSGFQGFPDKHSRATVFASSGWAQAMIGHVWLDGGARQALAIDPASGTDTAGNLQTTKWNDFPNLRWMGARTASTALTTGAWQCVEARIALNSPGASDGVFSLWIDDNLVADRNDLNWVGSYSDYGLNAVMISAYWNGGSPAAQERYIDSFVIATSRIGCGKRPRAPENLTVE